MRWRFGWFLMVMLLALMPAHAGAQKPSGIEWEVTPVFGQKYHPSEWMPLRVQVSNDGTDRRLDVHVGNFSTTLDVPGGSQKETILYVQLGQTTQIPMALYENEAKLDTGTLRLDPVSSPIIATLLDKAMPRIVGFEFINMTTSDMPTSEFGLSTLDGMVVAEQQWNELSGAQQTAIQNWVADGGTLIVVTTATNGLPEALKPAASSNPVTIGGARFASSLGYEQAAPDLAGVNLTPSDGSHVIASDQAQPILVQRSVLEGKVIASAIDVTDQSLLGWRGVGALWERMVQRSAASPWSGPFETTNSLRDGMAIGYLNNLSSLDLPPLRTLLILLGIYILLAGPINYVILRWRDRMAWAWITIPLLTAIFAVLAYGIGARQRGTDIIINELAIINGNGTKNATMQGYAGIFSPVKADYRLTAEANTLVRPLSPNGFTPPGNAQNAIYSQNPNEIPKMTVNQWTMESFAFERTINTAPTLKYDLTLDGSVVRGTVTNTSDQTLSDAVLVMFGDFQKIGTLKPNEERTIEIKLGTNINQNSISYMLYQQELDKAYQTPQGPSRDLLARTQSLDLLLPAMYGQQQAKPIFVAFVEQHTPTMSLPNQRFSRSQRTMYIEHPAFRFADKPLTLTNIWFNYAMASTLKSGGADFCNNSRGTGVNFINRTDDVIIRLPNEIANFQPTRMKFLPFLEGSMDGSKLEYELYNWDSATWEPQTLNGGSLTLDNPQAYLRNGQAKLRYTVPANIEISGGFWGCFSPGVTMEGAIQ